MRLKWLSCSCAEEGRRSSSKRELGQRKVFRRRVPAAAALRTQEEAGSSSLFSWISAAKRSRKLSDRSRLWSFY